MPAEALPYEPVSGPILGSVPLRREYRDPLGRPLHGSVVIAGGTRSDNGSAVMVAAPVTVQIDGVLDVSLPPGLYVLTADLRTVDGARVRDVDEVVLS